MGTASLVLCLCVPPNRELCPSVVTGCRGGMWPFVQFGSIRSCTEGRATDCSAADTQLEWLSLRFLFQKIFLFFLFVECLVLMKSIKSSCRDLLVLSPLGSQKWQRHSGRVMWLQSTASSTGLLSCVETVHCMASWEGSSGKFSKSRLCSSVNLLNIIFHPCYQTSIVSKALRKYRP